MMHIYPFVGFKSAIRAISGAAADPITPPKKGDDQEPTPQNWKIKMLYDGDCPLCMREVNLLQTHFLVTFLFIM